jgi:GT2 family glycosyltransferase/glycosyltransferase involved in cell wall biosynthesis
MDGIGFSPSVSDIRSVARPVSSGLEFERWADDRLHFMCRGLQSVTRVTIDGKPVPPEEWSLGRGTEAAISPARIARATGEHLSLRAEPAIYDGQPHKIDIAGLLHGKRARLTTSFTSEYRHALEAGSAGRLRGWIYDAAAPARYVRLTAVVPPAREMLVVASQERPDLSGPAARAGFELLWSPAGPDMPPETIELRVEGTNFCPFGRLRLPATGLAGLLEAPRLPPGYDAGGTVHSPPNAAMPDACYIRDSPARVAIIVPVHRGLDETMACLTSLRASADRVGHEVLVIDDASPDPALSRAVLEFAYEAGFHYLRNPEPLGFAASANAGIRLRPEDDIVLLHPHVEVPPFWLDRLYRAAMSSPAVAIAIPLSDDASMADPSDGGEPGDLPRSLSLAETDILCQRLNAGVRPAMGLAHGSCLYIRRDALNDIGLLDAAAFGHGPGGEIDFALRARQRGWRGVLAADVFVHHAAARTPDPDEIDDAAQGEAGRMARLLNERFAGFDAYLAAMRVADPLRPWRARLLRAQWAARPAPILMVTLALPGGTLRHVAGLTRSLQEQGHTVLWLRREQARIGAGGAPDGTELVLGEPGTSSRIRYGGADGVRAALADVFALSPRFIHVQHLIDLPPEVENFIQACGIPYVVTIHDYFYGCPRVTLLDEGGTFCGAPAADHCGPCLTAAPRHPALHPDRASSAGNAETWRDRWAPFLANAAQIIAPSQTAAHYMARLIPGLDITLRPHADGAAARALATVRGPDVTAETAPDPCRVAVIGAIGPHKGAAVLHHLIRHCGRHAADLRFVLIGHSDRDETLRRYANVELAGTYAPENAVTAIRRARCATALFLSVWPETFCFALSEALEAGLVPVGFDLGAIGERLRDAPARVLVPPGSNPETIVTALREAGDIALGRTASSPTKPPPRRHRRRAATVRTETAPDWLSSYYAPMPRPGGGGPPIMLGETTGLMNDLWCARHIDIALYAAMPLREVSLMFWYHPSHLAQNCRASLTGPGADPAHMGDAGAVVWLEPGHVSTLEVRVSDAHAALHRIIIAFDFTTQLDPPDRRRAAAKLLGLSILGADRQRIDYRLSPAREGTAFSLTRMDVST